MNSDLSCFIPHHGRAKTSLRIPESFDLYLCPPSCVRRVSIRALRNGTRETMGFLFLTEVDVAMGTYEEHVGDAVARVIASLERPPRAFFIHLNCVNDFLGTEDDDLLSSLRDRFPETGFAVMHMNPIAAEQGLSTGLRIHECLYRMLEIPSHSDEAVNLVGNFVGLGADCELSEVLHAWGIDEIRQLFNCRDYAEYQNLSASCLNLVIAPIGAFAAEVMESRLGIPHVYAPVTYALDEVRRQYRTIGKRLGTVAVPALDAADAAARAAVAHARDALGDTSIIVDSSATARPFALAKALFEYGFNVEAVFALHEKNDDAAARDWLVGNVPHLTVVRSESYEDIVGLGLSADAVCVGFDCAYLLKAHRFVDIQKDEGLFGFQAVRRLMELMTASLHEDTVWG